MAPAVGARSPYGDVLLLFLCFIWQLPTCSPFFTSKSPPSWSFSTPLQASPTTNGNSDESVTYLSEAQLRSFWQQAGLPANAYSEQAALSKMLLFSGDDDDDDDGEDFEDADEEEPVKTEKKTTKSILKKSLLLRRRQQTPKAPAVQVTAPAVVARAPLPVAATDALSPSAAAAAPTGRSVGIDLGTTFSAVSIIEGGRPVIIPVGGARVVPSVVAYTASGDVLVGESARRQYVVNPHNSFASVKRILGRTLQEVKNAGESLTAHKIVTYGSRGSRGGGKGGKTGRRRGGDEGGGDGEVALTCAYAPAGAALRPEHVSAEVIRALLKAAEAYLGSATPGGGSSAPPVTITRAVITVPAYFLPAQCEATTRAGQLAGLEKVKLLREPEAAALAYGLTQQARQVVLVFDLGGGTFDVSVLEVGGGFVEVIATSGDAHLGGDDFDAAIVDWLVDQYAQTTGDKEGAKALLKDPATASRLTAAAVDAKIALSAAPNVTIALPFLDGANGLTVVLKRTRFEALCKGLLTRLLTPLREVAIMAGINLPGESGQVGVREDMFFAGYDDDDDGNTNKGVLRRDPTNNPTEGEDGAAAPVAPLTVAALKKLQLGGRASAKEAKRTRGSATKELRRLQKETMDASLASFPGGQMLDDVILVGGSTRIPAVQRLVRSVTGVEPRRTVNPDEAVSLGAAVMAGILDGDIADMQVVTAWQAAMYRAFYDDYRKGTPAATATATAGAAKPK